MFSLNPESSKRVRSTQIDDESHHYVAIRVSVVQRWDNGANNDLICFIVQIFCKLNPILYRELLFGEFGYLGLKLQKWMSNRHEWAQAIKLWAFFYCYGCFKKKYLPYIIINVSIYIFELYSSKTIKHLILEHLKYGILQISFYYAIIS